MGGWPVPGMPSRIRGVAGKWEVGTRHFISRSLLQDKRKTERGYTKSVSYAWERFKEVAKIERK